MSVVCDPQTKNVLLAKQIIQNFLADIAVLIDLCSSVLHQSLSTKAGRALQNRPQ